MDTAKRRNEGWGPGPPELLVMGQVGPPGREQLEGGPLKGLGPLVLKMALSLRSPPGQKGHVLPSSGCLP